MGVIATNENQLTLIYSSNTRVGRWTLSYLEGIDKPYLAIDLCKTKVADTQWVEIAEKLNVSVGDLVDKREMEIEVENTSDLDDNDWIKVIQKNDKVISYPIAIMGNKIKQIINAPSIMDFFEVDSAGLEQSPAEGNTLDIERTTDDETFIEGGNI
ncbi:arsenate reductase family protein [Aequorivita ciconiae]|nr:hypothetical protein [Aequorivita sp. H23M31]